MIFEKYKKVQKDLQKRLNIKNPSALPRIEKVIINAGIGKILGGIVPDKKQKVLDEIKNNITIVCGQAPILTSAKQSVSAFKLREGSPSGYKVTLRHIRMFDFLDRFFYTALPRTRDFAGIPEKSIDASGNLTIGVRECIVFPELNPEDIHYPFGVEIIIVTKAKKREDAVELYRALGLPISKEVNNRK